MRSAPSVRGLPFCVWLLASSVSAQSGPRLPDAGVPLPPAVEEPAATTPASPLAIEAQELAAMPGLTKQHDGTYSYHGRGFDAVIERDGSVRMRNVFARSRAMVKPRKMLNGEWAVMYFESRYDIWGWLERMFGNDPDRNERQAFLEATLPLRERVATRLAVEKLAQALSQIWSQRGLAFAQRKQRIFELWDASAEDELGQTGRAFIGAFIREHCPRGDMRGYTEAELRDANAHRRSKGAFDPYAEPAQ